MLPQPIRRMESNSATNRSYSPPACGRGRGWAGFSPAMCLLAHPWPLPQAGAELRLARRVDQRRLERFLGPLVAPQHELERRIEPVALGDRAFDRELRHL